MPTASKVTTGPGLLYVAPLGTAEPTAASSTLNVAFREIGYTDAGSTITTEITSEDVEVAESLDAIAKVQSKRTTGVGFAMAETTRRNLALALGAPSETGTGRLDFPDIDDLQSVMLIHKPDTGGLWLFRKVAPSGTITINNQKSPQKRLFAVTMNAEVPDTGAIASIFPAGAGGPLDLV